MLSHGHDSDGVLWFHAGLPCVCPSIRQSYVRHSVRISFPGDNFSKHQWIFTKFGTRDVRNELLISIWRLQISSLPKSTHFMPSKYSPWLEMQSFSRCIHFLKASRYADLGTVIRY